MNKIILIEKDSPSCDWWPNLIKETRIPGLSVEAMVNKYQGFEGELSGGGQAFDFRDKFTGGNF